MPFSINLPPGYSLRLARDDEAVILPELERRAGALFRQTPFAFVADSEPGTAETFMAHIRMGLGFVAAATDDTAAGFAMAGQLDDALHLYELAVDPAHGRRGLGRALVLRVCAEAESRGLDVTLSTFRNVPWNAPFYETLGFRIVEDFAMTPGLVLVRSREEAGPLPIEERCLMRYAPLAG